MFRTFFLLFTASVRSRPPGPPAVPGVLAMFLFCGIIQASLLDTNKDNDHLFALWEIDFNEINAKYFIKTSWSLVVEFFFRWLITDSGTVPELLIFTTKKFVQMQVGNLFEGWRNKYRMHRD